MRLSISFVILLTPLLLTACLNTKEEEAKEKVAQANFKLGISYMQSGHLEVASEKLLKALQFKEDFPEAHNAIAVLYEEMREYNPAVTHFQRAIELKPNYTLARLNYARLLCTQEPLQLDQGEATFRQIVEDPKNAGATAADGYVGLATCAIKRDDSNQVEHYLRQALKSDSKNTNALFELAALSQRQGKTLQSRAFLQRYHARSRPTPQSLWLGILIERSSEGDRILYQRYISLLTSQYPNSNETRRLKQLE